MPEKANGLHGIQRESHSPSSSVAALPGEGHSRPLVIRFGAMGDMVLVTGLLQALHHRFGRSCDVVGSGPWTNALLNGHRNVHSLYLIKSRRRPYFLSPEQWRLVQWLRHRPRGPVYVCDHLAQRKLRSLLSRAGIPRKDCVFFDRSSVPIDTHWFEAWRALAGETPDNFQRQSGASMPYPESPAIESTASARQDAKEFLSQRGIRGPVILVQPGNKRSYKRGPAGLVGNDKAWPADQWTSLCQLMLSDLPDAHVLLCGVAAEQPLLQQIATATGCKQVHALGECLPISRFMAIANGAHSMVSVDTGPAHAAVAVGCPAVVLYGENSPLNWLPRGPRGTPVLAMEALPGEPRRVESIELGRVIEAWRSLGAHPKPHFASHGVKVR